MSERYMIVTYYKKPTGKWDEITEFKNNLSIIYGQLTKDTNKILIERDNEINLKGSEIAKINFDEKKKLLNEEFNNKYKELFNKEVEKAKLNKTRPKDFSKDFNLPSNINSRILRSL